MSNESIHELVKVLGIAIGSRAWDCSKEDSDYDYAIAVEDWYTVNKVLQDKGIDINPEKYETSVKFEEYTSVLFNKYNIKFKLGGKSINLLVYKSTDMYLARGLNRIFKDIKVNKPALWNLIQTDKDIRIASVRQALMHTHLFQVNVSLFGDDVELGL